MPLNKIIWNGLYSAQLFKQVQAAVRICMHYKRMGLEKHQVTTANVWYVSICLMCLLLTACSETGWHSESSAAKHGSHLTVHFKKENDNHYATHHIYRTNKVYGCH
jgi:hypothetical protein